MVAVTHSEIDARLLRLHRAVADRLRAEPALIEVARATLGRWRARGISPVAMGRWAALLDGPPEALLAALVEDSPAMRDLRQSSPFAGPAFLGEGLRRRLLDGPAAGP